MSHPYPTVLRLQNVKKDLMENTSGQPTEVWSCISANSGDICLLIL